MKIFDKDIFVKIFVLFGALVLGILAVDLIVFGVASIIRIAFKYS